MTGIFLNEACPTQISDVMPRKPQQLYLSQHFIWICFEPCDSVIQALTSKQTDSITALGYDLDFYHACNPYTNSGGAAPSRTTLRTHSEKTSMRLC